MTQHFPINPIVFYKPEVVPLNKKTEHLYQLHSQFPYNKHRIEIFNLKQYSRLCKEIPLPPLVAIFSNERSCTKKPQEMHLNL